MAAVRIPWNIVTKNLSLSTTSLRPGNASVPLEKRLQQKLAKFDRFLAQFPPDAVHLQIVLGKHPRTQRYLASLTLRVPSDILHSEEAGRDPIGAFDEAVKSLLRKSKSYQSSVRGEKHERHDGLQQVKLSGFAFEPQEAGEGPQSHTDVVRELIQQHYKELLRHVRRHILHDEAAGELPKDELSPPDVLNDVMRHALTKANAGPKRGSWLAWLYQLIREELKRERGLLKKKMPKPAKDAPQAEPAAVAKPADTAEVSEIAARKDVLSQLEVDMWNWPRPEREVFELYYVEGLEPEEIAMVTSQPLKTVFENLVSIQQRLRQEMLAQRAA